MSVHLHTLVDSKQLPVEIWAPDYSSGNVTLIYASEDDVGDRIDLSLDQLRQLRDVANGILGNSPTTGDFEMPMARRRGLPAMPGRERRQGET